MTDQLRDKVAIITGGASGIGLGAVELFVAQGGKVVVGDIQDDLGAELEARFPEDVGYVRTDVSDESQVEALVAATVARFGRLDIMFNNAGANGDAAPLLELTAAGLDRTLRLLVGSVVAGHRFAAQQFIAQGEGGSIISTASGASYQGGWSSTAYTIAKHAVVGVVRTAAAELGQYGIRSNAIAPGITITPIMSKSFDVPLDRASEFEEILTTRLSGLQPLGRVGRPLDIAQAAMFLASDAGDWITGTVLPVDGGLVSVTHSTLASDLTEISADFHTS